MRRRGLLAVLIVLLLGGCSVGPDYQTPTSPMPAAYSEPGAASRSDDMREWWHLFQDPELESLVDRALTGNPDLQSALSRIREARALAVMAGAALLPQIDADGSVNHTHISQNSGLGSLATLFSGAQNGSGFAFPGGGLTTYSVGFDASWEIDIFGGVRRSVESAVATADQAAWTSRDVRISLVAEVANDYLALRAAQRQVVTVRRDVARQQEILALVSAQRRFGFVTAMTVRDQQGQVSAAEAMLPDLDSEIALQAHALALLLGEAPAALLAELTPVAALPAAPPLVPLGLPSDLLRRRPDIRAAERALAATSARIGVAVADLYPKFSLTGAFDFIALDPGHLFKWPSRQYSAAGAISWPIFEGGQIRANIQVQQEEDAQALLTYRATVLGALKDVENALTRLREERTKNATLHEQLSRAQEAVALARGRYEAGLTPLTPVLNGQGAALTAERDIATSDAALDRDMVSLFKALGG